MADDQLLELRDKDLTELAGVDVPEEVICTDFSCLPLEEHLDDGQCLRLEHDDVASLVLGELEAVDEILEGKQEVGLLEQRALDFLLIQIVVE